jgi:DNA primase
MPLTWREVNQTLEISQHTIVTAPQRLAKLKQDPVSPVLSVRPDLPAVLERLMTKLASSE